MEIQYYIDEKSRRRVVREILSQTEAGERRGATVVAYYRGLPVSRGVHGLFIHAYDDITYLGGTPARIAELPIRQVRLSDSAIDEGVSPEQGRYSMGNASALLRKTGRATGEFEDEKFILTWKIEVVGPTLDEVVQLYEAIFSGQLTPWQMPQAEVLDEQARSGRIKERLG